MKALLSYRAIFALIAGFLCFLGQSSFAQDFYAGKTIRIIVGFPAGGGFDTYSRVLGRHIGKHIPGNPSVVVDNVTGAGSLIAANTLYKSAKPDGLTIGNFIGNLIRSNCSAVRASSSTRESSNGSAYRLRIMSCARSRKRAASTPSMPGQRRSRRSSSVAAHPAQPMTMSRN